jgi:hypothetical protein
METSMIRITADLFSGRTNPQWLVTDPAETNALLREISREGDAVAASASSEAGLGLRGFRLELLSDVTARNTSLPTDFYVAAGPFASGPVGHAGNAIAERLIGLIPGSAMQPMAAEDTVLVDAALAELLTEQLNGPTTMTQDDGPQLELDALQAIADGGCQIEATPFNPAFWNNNPTTLSQNNCYNYATNHATNTFAQPGRGCGHIYPQPITCNGVTAAALCDGVHQRGICFPPQEAWRYLVALVVAPSSSFNDYHWYRYHPEGFWGHKPGGTAARNVDNNGAIVRNPATAARGPYTQFCGFFYTCHSQWLKIK